jgi:hypothetical protein
MKNNLKTATQSLKSLIQATELTKNDKNGIIDELVEIAKLSGFNIGYSRLDSEYTPMLVPRGQGLLMTRVAVNAINFTPFFNVAVIKGGESPFALIALSDAIKNGKFPTKQPDWINDEHDKHDKPQTKGEESV